MANGKATGTDARLAPGMKVTDVGLALAMAAGHVATGGRLSKGVETALLKWASANVAKHKPAIAAALVEMVREGKTPVELPKNRKWSQPGGKQDANRKVADLLGVSASSVEQWRRKNKK